MDAVLSNVLPKRVTRMLIAAAIAIISFSSAAVPASAAGPVPGEPTDAVKLRSTYAIIAGYSSNCTTDGDITTCNYSSVSVYDIEQSDPLACAAVYSYQFKQDGTYIPGDEGYGCTPVDSSTFDMKKAKKLESATLAPVTITLNTYECSYDNYENPCQVVRSRDVMVSASYTGVGELQSYKSNDGFEYENCSYKFQSKAYYRGNNASFSIAGEQTNAQGFMVSADSAFKANCD